jgi:hypothetical protein
MAERRRFHYSHIEPGSPWENGYIESFNARMRAEFLNGELFDTMFEAQVLTQRWIQYYNQIRPHSSLGGRPPAPQTVFQSPPRIPSLLTLLLTINRGQITINIISINYRSYSGGIE